MLSHRAGLSSRFRRAGAAVHKRSLFGLLGSKNASKPPINMNEFVRRELQEDPNFYEEPEKLPTLPKDSLIETRLPFILTSVYDHPKRAYRFARASSGSMLSRAATSTLIRLGRGDLVSSSWLRDFDAGSHGAFAAVVRAFETKNPLTLQPVFGDMMWSMLKDAWPYYSGEFDYNLRVFDITQKDRWMNVSVELPKFKQEMQAVYHLTSGASVRYSVPATKELLKMKELAQHSRDETVADMLIGSGMKDWQIKEYLAGRPIGQVDEDGSIIPVHSAPAPLMGKKSRSQAAVYTVGGSKEDRPENRVVGAHVTSPDFMRKLAREFDFAAKGSFRSLKSYLSEASSISTEYLLRNSSLRLSLGVIFSARHDFKLWRRGKFDSPLYEVVEKEAPHYAIFETIVPLDPSENRTSEWRLTDIDAFVATESHDFRRRYNVTMALNQQGLKGEEKARAKVFMLLNHDPSDPEFIAKTTGRRQKPF